MAVFPTFGEGAFVNIDDPASSDNGFSYHSNWNSYSLPAAVYEVAGKILAVWFNSYTDNDAVQGIRAQCRFITPTSPPIMGSVTTFFDESMTRIFASGAYRGYVSMWNQQTMSNAVIGTSLYINFGWHSTSYSSYPSTYTRTGGGMIVRIDCSGAEPVIANTVVIDATWTGGFTVDKTLDYNLAAIDGKLLAVPMYAGGDDNVYCYDENLNQLWSQNGSVWVDLDATEIMVVADSETDISWAMGWGEDVVAFQLGVSGLTILPGSWAVRLIDSSVTGIADPGGFGDIYDGVFQSDVTLYPRVSTGVGNEMVLWNYGYLSWKLSYDNGWNITTMWMFDFLNPAAPGNTSFGYGYTYSNGPSYAYAGKVPGNEIMIMPRYDVGEDVGANTFMNIGWDAAPEEQQATFLPSTLGQIYSWTEKMCAAQISGGSGILLVRNSYPDGEDAEPYGKILAIPFSLGAPNLAGALEARQRMFWRPRSV